MNVFAYIAMKQKLGPFAKLNVLSWYCCLGPLLNIVGARTYVLGEAEKACNSVLVSLASPQTCSPAHGRPGGERKKGYSSDLQTTRHLHAAFVT